MRIPSHQRGRLCHPLYLLSRERRDGPIHAARPLPDRPDAARLGGGWLRDQLREMLSLMLAWAVIIDRRRA